MTSVKIRNKFFIFLILLVVAGSASLASATGKTEPFTLSLTEVPEGNLPAGWKIDATDPRGPLADSGRGHGSRCCQGR